jgi:hypothetical protein
MPDSNESKTVKIHPARAERARLHRRNSFTNSHAEIRGSHVAGFPVSSLGGEA